jgi:predicted O-methyltransferase YrrM
MIGLLRAAPGLVHRSFQWVTPDGETTVALQLFEDTDVRGLVTHALRAHSLYYSSDQVEEITAGVCGDVPHAVVRFCSHFRREDVRLPDTGPTYHQVGTAALLAPWYDPALYSFRHYWHLKHVPVWRTALAGLVGRQGAAVLEIGSFEGLASAFLLHEILTHETARLVCVDTFQGSSEHLETEVEQLIDRHRANLRATGALEKVTVLVGDSKRVLHGLALGSFDVVYVDGSHHAADVLQDGVLAWGLLKPGGLLIFDDYEWPPPPDPDGLVRDHLTHPKPAVDAFLRVMAKELDVVHHDYQVMVRKRS